MNKSVTFYKDLGLVVSFGGPKANFTTLELPDDVLSFYVNLIYRPNYFSERSSSWGRCIIYVTDVDEMYHLIVQRGLIPEFSPRDASWRERYFHILDPSGHELSFAKKLLIKEEI
mmetsp:Transcript_35469/g.39238  ORF Transcript_35469/g.39238 Transcript_35469/m.39238 type:complete len:115 (-) Transcript_35469:21-365(-)